MTFPPRILDLAAIRVALLRVCYWFLLMLPWFQDQFPLYLAPMAGVTNTIFRQMAKEFGADVMVTEFVSAEGIFRRNERTLAYLEFVEAERPLGVQLFGADPVHLGEAAKMVLDWKQPDFLDLNFGCPVNKVVAKNGGSALLKDCPLLAKIARSVVMSAAPCPVTAKIRTGWDDRSINAVTTARILEDAGIAAIAVHGRTKEQGYGGEADWDVISQVAAAVRVPVIGNGDIAGASDVRARMKSGVRGIMIGRAAMSAPWIFSEIKQFLATGVAADPFPIEAQWTHILRHARRKVAYEGSEIHALQSMRTQFMHYSRGMPEAKRLRERFAHVSSLLELETIAAEHLASRDSSTPLLEPAAAT
ncbi:MAG: tRNA dihydrouridine synthase DusB [Chthoniobacteraceae bacterium]